MAKDINILNKPLKDLFSLDIFQKLGLPKGIMTRLVNSLRKFVIFDERFDFETITVQEFLEITFWKENYLGWRGKELNIYNGCVPGIGIKGQKAILELFKFFNIEIRKVC